jgi:thiol-disulfide isomerase/thioredoxin
MMRKTVILVLSLVAALAGCNETPTVTSGDVVVAHLPTKLDPKCRQGEARLYDECGSQLALFETARAEAAKSGKVVLVSFGAEWCIWCHVFDSHLGGGAGRFRYPLEGDEVTLVERSGEAVLPDAKALNDFAAKAFVLVHIEGDHAPDGWRVLEAAGIDVETVAGYPYIFTVDADGRLAKTLDPNAAETRRDIPLDWYRGYDRKSLMKHLAGMRDAALKPAESAP